MDEQPPASDQPTSPPADGVTGPYEPVAPPSRASRARITALVLAVLVVLTGGGTVLLLRASNSTQSLDRFVPDTVAAYLKFSIHPSVEQQQKVEELLSRFPTSVRGDVSSKLDDALDSALKKLNLSYRNDVKPWVGGQIVVAVLAPAGAQSDSPSGAPNVIGIVAVKDAAAAQKTLSKLKNADPKAPAFEIQGGVAYLGESQNNIDAFKNAVSSGHTLADNANYKREHDRAGGDGLVFGFADLTKIAGLAPSLRGDILGSGLTGGSGIVALSLRAETQGIVLTGHSAFPASTLGGHAGTFKILPTTPDDLLGSVSFFDLGDLVGGALKTLSRGFGIQPAATNGQQVPGLSAATGVLKEIEQALGLNLQKDLLPWLKGELSIIVGPVTNPPIPNIGIVVAPTDEAALGRTMHALRTHLGALLGANGKVQSDANGLTVKTPLGVDIVVRTTAARVVIATGLPYANRLLSASDQSLSGDAVYKAAVDPSKPTVFQVFVRLDRVRTLVEGLMKLSNPNGYAAYERNVQPIVTPLQALGIQSTISDGTQDFRLIIAIAKP